MKKLLYLMVSGAFLLSSCSKEMAEPQNTAQMNLVPAQQGETQILEFLAVYENWKSNPEVTFNNMSKADAVWLMEASINYLNGFQLSYWEDLKTVESSYSPTFVEGSTDVFTGSTILSTFALMDAAITNQKTNKDHNMILVVDLYLDEENSSQIIMKGSSANSYPFSNISDPFQIGADDYWLPTSLQGKCDIYSGQFAGAMDAAERVEDIVNHNWWFNHYRNLYNPQDVLYYTNVDSKDTPPNTSHDPNSLWGGPNMSTCLNPSDMQLVFTQDEQVAFSGIPTGSELISVDYTGGFLYLSGSPAFHTLKKYYGEPHIQ